MSISDTEIRFYDPAIDLETVERWWAAQEAPVKLGEILPDDGIIIPDLCAAWIYLPRNSKIGWVAWMVANPKASPRAVHDGLEVVLYELNKFAKECGVVAVTAFTEISGLTKVLKRVGFQATPTKKTSLWMRI